MTPEEWTAVRLSLLVATTATLASLPVGVAIAWLLARKQFWGKGLLDTLVHLPLIMPPVVTGYLLLISFGRRAPIGAFLADNFDIVFSFRWTGAALACGVMGFPLLVRAIRLSIEAVDTRLESAAGTLGANPLHHPAALPARRDRRRHPVLRQGDGRVRRHHHLRLQYPG
jgi:molybdate transport system permease protein